MSQLGWTDVPGSPEVAAAVTAFHRAVATARAHGLSPRTLHLGGTPAALLEPRAASPPWPTGPTPPPPSRTRC